MDFSIKNSSYKLKELSYVLCYYNTKCEILKKDTADERISSYLSLYYDEIMFFSRQYPNPPNNYQAVLFLINALQPYAIKMVEKIIAILGKKIIDKFSISPTAYNSFANLITTISNIDITMAQEIYNNDSVWEKLTTSITTDDLNNQAIGLKSLLISINLIAPNKYTEFLANEAIKQILLAHFGSLESILR